MPSISGSSPAITDPVEYFSKQLPADLIQMISLRDELAKRQGAMSAVAETLVARDEAKKKLANAEKEAEEMLDKAKEKLEKAKAKVVAADVKEDKLAKAEADFDIVFNNKSATLAELEKKLTEKEADIAYRQNKLTAAEAAVVQDRAALEARIKVFQDKVAALSP